MVRRIIAGRRVGELEVAIMRELWSVDDWISGRELLERLGDKTRAYTTVMTVLGRMVDKLLVERTDEGRGHLYRAAGDPDELTGQAINSLLKASQDPRMALTHFVEGIDDPALLADLKSALEHESNS